MGYSYSNGLCDEALRRMNTDDPLESRLASAFSEMNVSKYGDTSEEIWNEWKELKKRYYTVTGEIYKLRKEGEVISDVPDELKQFGESLITLIGEWKQFNNSQLSQGKRMYKKVS